MVVGVGINGAADEPLAAHVRRQFYRPSLQHRHGLPLPTPSLSGPRLIPSRNGEESGVVSRRYDARRRERKEGRKGKKGLWSTDAAATLSSRGLDLADVANFPR